MVWFGFGFNGFGQIYTAVRSSAEKGHLEKNVEVKVTVPVRIAACNAGGTLNGQDESNEACPCGRAEEKKVTEIRTSWSRRATLSLGGDARLRLRLSGFGAPAQTVCGCKDAQLTETHLTLLFEDRAECWSLATWGHSPVWKMDLGGAAGTGPPLALPLLPGGYVTADPPLFRPLSPELRAVSLALGLEHAVLLTASGSVYTWGLGSHGQLGHGGLEAVEEPKIVEALWGVAMAGVAAGNWHSAAISTGGDVYTWGWNESGQLGIPARGLQEERKHTDQDQGTSSDTDGEDSRGVFISIQAFPALVDLPEESEVTKISCGSRHTAAVTGKGNLFTWGWGHYGQLGHGSSCSSDQPQQVDFFSDALFVSNVVCGPWNTFVSVVERVQSVENV